MTEPTEFNAGAVNPYASAEATQPHTVAADLRPTGVTVIGVMSVIGGGFAILGSAMFALQLAFGAMFAGAMTPPGKAGEVQADYMAQIQAVSDRFMIPNVAVTLTNCVIGVFLIVGAIKLLRRQPGAATFVRRVLLAVIVFELVRLIPTLMMQMQIYPLTQAFMEKTVNTQGNNGAPPMMMKSIQQISMIIGIVFMFGWLTVKLGLVIWSRVYLKRQNVIDYFAGSSVQNETPN